MVLSHDTHSHRWSWLGSDDMRVAVVETLYRFIKVPFLKLCCTGRDSVAGGDSSHESYDRNQGAEIMSRELSPLILTRHLQCLNKEPPYTMHRTFTFHALPLPFPGRVFAAHPKFSVNNSFPNYVNKFIGHSGNLQRHLSLATKRKRRPLKTFPIGHQTKRRRLTAGCLVVVCRCQSKSCAESCVRTQLQVSYFNGRVNFDRN